MNLALINSELDFFRVGKISKKYPSLSDHKLIVMEWKDIEIQENKKIQVTTSE